MARRDTALLMVLLDAGPRCAELLGMRLEDLDFECDVVRVIGKGGRERALPFGRKTALALDRYLRVRSRHRLAHLEALWISQRGPLTFPGLRDLLDRRARQAGVPGRTIGCSSPARTSNGPTEAINGRLEHLRGAALCFRNLTNYIVRSLLETGGFRPDHTLDHEAPLSTSRCPHDITQRRHGRRHRTAGRTA